MHTLIFAYVSCYSCFYSSHSGNHIPSSWMVHAECVFVAGIHLSRTMSGSFESEGWNACVHQPDLHLSSHPKEFWGNGVRIHVNFEGKIPSTRKKFSSEEDRIHDTASSRTASPTHYQWAFPAPTYSFNQTTLLLAPHPLSQSSHIPISVYHQAQTHKPTTPQMMKTKQTRHTASTVLLDKSQKSRIAELHLKQLCTG